MFRLDIARLGQAAEELRRGFARHQDIKRLVWDGKIGEFFVLGKLMRFGDGYLSLNEGLQVMLLCFLRHTWELFGPGTGDDVPRFWESTIETSTPWIQGIDRIER